jgi:hypothetical protein
MVNVLRIEMAVVSRNPLRVLRIALMLMILACSESAATPFAPRAATTTASSVATSGPPGSGPPSEEKSRRVEPDQAAATAREVLEGSQFWWKHRGTIDDPTRGLGFFSRVGDVLETIWNWVLDGLKWLFLQLRNLFAFAPSGFQDSASFARILVYVLAIVAVVFLGWKGYGLLRNRRRSPVAVLPADISQLEELPDAFVLFDRAQQALQNGQNAQALRFAFLALLALLQDRGILRYSRSRTNREYARDLRGEPKLASDFRGVALPFERAQYGHVEPTGIDVRNALAVCQSLFPERGQVP